MCDENGLSDRCKQILAEGDRDLTGLYLQVRQAADRAAGPPAVELGAVLAEIERIRDRFRRHV